MFTFFCNSFEDVTIIPPPVVIILFPLKLNTQYHQNYCKVSLYFAPKLSASSMTYKLYSFTRNFTISDTKYVQDYTSQYIIIFLFIKKPDLKL